MVYNIRVKKIGLVAVVALSCDWFGLREPDPGTGPPHWQNPTEAHIVLDNMTNALTYILPDNYVSCLDEFFVQSADPSLTDSIYKNWTRATEDSVIRNLMAQLDYSQDIPIQVNLVVTDSSGGSQSYDYEISYDITVFTATGDILLARGTARLNLVKQSDTQLWDILSWEDFKEDTTSWAEVKARYR